MIKRLFCNLDIGRWLTICQNVKISKIFKIALPLLAACFILLSIFLQCSQDVILSDALNLRFRPSLYTQLFADEIAALSEYHYHGHKESSNHGIFMAARTVKPDDKPEPQEDKRLLNYKFTGCPAIDRWPQIDEIIPEVSFHQVIHPSVVNYVWLGKETFTLRNYLSILSVIKFLQPVKIIFHVQHEPLPDGNRYHHWFEELRGSVSYLIVKQLPSFYRSNHDDAIKSVIDDNGGFYIPNDVILLRQFEPELIFDSKQQGLSSKISAKSRYGILTVAECVQLRWDQTLRVDNATLTARCIELPYEIYPTDFFTESDELSQFLRELFYGSRLPLAPAFSPGRIPSICHYVWIGGVEIDFVAYLSVLSCLFIGQADYVLIHGDMAPRGFRWDRLVKMMGTSGRIKFMEKERPETVYGNEAVNVAHISDLWRVDMLLKYGGVYLDWDAVMLQKITSLLPYDALANYDILDWKPYPKVLNLGVFAAKKHSLYLRMLKESMRYFNEKRDFDFAFRYNPCQIPYKVYECFPNLLKIDPHLQVICFLGSCHPTWQKDFTNLDLHYDLDWKREAFTVHWTYPNPPELESEQSLRDALTAGKASNVMAVQMAEYVLKSANIKLEDLL